MNRIYLKSFGHIVTLKISYVCFLSFILTAELKAFDSIHQEVNNSGLINLQHSCDADTQLSEGNDFKPTQNLRWYVDFKDFNEVSKKVNLGKNWKYSEAGLSIADTRVRRFIPLDFKDEIFLRKGESLRLELKRQLINGRPLVIELGQYIIIFGDTNTLERVNDSAEAERKRNNYIVSKRKQRLLGPIYFSPVEVQQDQMILTLSYNSGGFSVNFTDKESKRSYGFEWPLKLVEEQLLTKVYYHAGRTIPQDIFYNISLGKLDAIHDSQVIPVVDKKRALVNKMKNITWGGEVKKTVRKLVFEGFDNGLTNKELEGATYHLLNQNPKLIRPFYVPWMSVFHYPWLYKKTSNKELLDHIISLAEVSYHYRSDIHPELKTGLAFKYKDRFQLSDLSLAAWLGVGEGPWFVEKSNTVRKFGVASFAGIAYAASAARSIAENPAIWDEVFTAESPRYNTLIKRYKGLKYKDVCTKIIEDTLPVIECLEAIFLEWSGHNEYSGGLEHLFVLAPVGSGETEYAVPIFNRGASVLVGLAYLSKAMHELKVHIQLANKLDAIVRTNVDFWISNLKVYTSRKGMQTAWYNYSANTTRHQEDLGHGWFTQGAYKFLNYDGYIDDEVMQLIANHLVSCHTEHGLFSLSGFGEGELLFNKGDTPGYWHLAEWNMEVFDLLNIQSLNKQHIMGLLRSKENRNHKNIFDHQVQKQYEYLIKFDEFIKKGKIISCKSVVASSYMDQAKGHSNFQNVKANTGSCAVDGLLHRSWRSDPNKYHELQSLSVEFAKELEVNKISILWDLDYATTYDLELLQSNGERVVLRRTKHNSQADHLMVLGRGSAKIKSFKISNCEVQKDRKTIGIKEVKVNDKFTVINH